MCDGKIPLTARLPWRERNIFNSALPLVWTADRGLAWRWDQTAPDTAVATAAPNVCCWTGLNLANWAAPNPLTGVCSRITESSLGGPPDCSSVDETVELADAGLVGGGALPCHWSCSGMRTSDRRLRRRPRSIYCVVARMSLSRPSQHFLSVRNPKAKPHVPRKDPSNGETALVGAGATARRSSYFGLDRDQW
jgi:hypothetical protein